MQVVRPQLTRQLHGSPQADRRAFDIHQGGGTRADGQRRPLTQAPIGNHQQALLLAGLEALPALQPVVGLLQGRDQRAAAAGTELAQPLLQSTRGFLTLPVPLRLGAMGVEYGNSRALPVSTLEQFGQQALGLAQSAVAPGRGRGIDDDQP